MKKGAYRKYYKIPFVNIGIKVASFGCKRDANRLVTFLVAMTMNILERKRYKYYCQGKSFKQWGGVWKYEGRKVRLAPTYFSCGFFNLVRHVETFQKSSDSDMEGIDGAWNGEKFGYLFEHDLTWNNIGWHDGDYCLVDYGDYRIGGYNHFNPRWIDYR